MINKKLIFITLILIALFAISAVSAADDTDTLSSDEEDILDASNEDILDETEDENLNSANEDEQLSATTKTFTDLDDAINGNTDTVINLTDDYTYYNSSDSRFKNGVEINREVTINGNGITIDGSNIARIFKIDANNVIINNITFINGNATKVTESYDDPDMPYDSYTLDSGDGGAIEGNQKFTVVNCDFTNNHADHGGAIYNGNAENCDFTNNHADTYGGAIYNGNAENCDFTNNHATNEGGAIMGGGDAINCTFTNNHADAYGGAMSGGDAVNCTFTQNNAYSGGAIIDSNAVNCTFINNQASIGGAIYNWGSHDVSGCYFVNNTGSNGIIYYHSTGAVNNNIFLNNNGTEIVLDNSNVNTDCNWFGNNASNYNANARNYLSTWLFLNATINPDNLTVSTIPEITFRLYLYNSTSGKISDYDNTLLKNINLTITQSKGKVDRNTTQLGSSIQYTPAELGTDNVTATAENAKYTIKLNNIKIDPELSVDTKDVTYPENATLTLNYNSDATGKVNITLKGNKQNRTFKNLELNNTITLTLENLDIDEYNITITYSGDDKFLNATATAKLTINIKQFEIDANITGVALNDVKTDQNATVTIDTTNIPDHATGKIIINVTGIDKNYTIEVPVSSNTIQIDIIATPGTYKLNAQYTGDNNYNASNLVTKTFEVSNWNETDLQDLIDNSTGNVTLEHNYTFTNPNATVNVTNATSINGNNHTIDANGSSTALNITADNVTVSNMTVSNVNGTAIASNGTNTTVENVNLDNVNGTAVQITGDNATVNNITATNTNGTLISVTGDNITVTNVNSTDNTTISVDGKVNKIENITGATVIPSIKATNVVKGADVIITATVSATEGNVTVTFQGKNYTAPVNDGKAVITIPNIEKGTYNNIPVAYEGTGIYQNVSTTTSFTSKVDITGNKDVTIDYLSGYKYTVRIVNADGTYAAGVTVKMTVNGVTYKIKTDKNGYAKLPIKLMPKTYKITVQYLNVKKTNTIKVKSTIFLVKKTVTVKKTAKKLVLKAKLKWSSGKAIKGKVIKFKFKGKTYKAKTNSKGIAKVKIKKKVIKKLKKGKKYKFTAKYVNEYVKGKVKVKK